jgi:hypothetical protein
MNINNLTETEQQDFYRLLKKMNVEEPDKKQDIKKYPKQGSVVYVLSLTGEVAKLAWQGLDYDLKLWKFGNVFFTEEEAEIAREKKKVEVELQRYADEHNDKTLKARFCIQYDDENTKKLTYGVWSLRLQGVVMFTSKQLVFDAIEAVGKDRILKYIFGVESEGEE